MVIHERQSKYNRCDIVIHTIIMHIQGCLLQPSLFNLFSLLNLRGLFHLQLITTNYRVKLVPGVCTVDLREGHPMSQRTRSPVHVAGGNRDTVRHRDGHARAAVGACREPCEAGPLASDGGGECC